MFGQSHTCSKQTVTGTGLYQMSREPDMLQNGSKPCNIVRDVRDSVENAQTSSEMFEPIYDVLRCSRSSRQLIEQVTISQTLSIGAQSISIV